MLHPYPCSRSLNEQDKSAKKRKREKAAARESSNGSSSVAGPSSIPDESAKKVSKKKQSTGVAEPSTSTSSFAEVHKPQKPSAKAKAGKVSTDRLACFSLVD